MNNPEDFRASNGEVVRRLGAQRLFVKTGELTASNGSGIESSMNAQMNVIKVLL